MARLDFANGSEERAMFNDLWNFCQDFWIPEEGKDYWNNLVDAAENLEQKYHNSLLCSWVADFISQKEAEYHDMKGDTYGEDGETSGTM